MKIYDIETIEPKGILSWFKKICAIPHGSFKEHALVQMLQDNLKKTDCEIITFSSGAFLVRKKATPGLEKLPWVMLQGHTDMVQVKEDNLDIDMSKTPIKPYYDTEKKWIKAEGTSLGADNGIAIAIMMEVLTNPDVAHGPIECLFTTGEEVDSTICMKSIPKGCFKSKQIINLDCDDDTSIFVGSGSCSAISIDHKYKENDLTNDGQNWQIKLSNFTGGHSGGNIHLAHINPIIMLATALYEFAKHDDLNIITWEGGFVDNAIPTYCNISIKIPNNTIDKLKKIIDKHFTNAKIIAQGHDNQAIINYETISLPATNKMLSIKDSLSLLRMLYLLPNGMYNQNKSVGCMFNSSNLGKIRLSNCECELGLSSRSFIDSDCLQIANKIVDFCRLFKIRKKETSINLACGAWLVPDIEKSSLIQTWRNNFVKIHNMQPKILSIAGGLEIADIIKKSPQMVNNSLSCGPKIIMEHSTSEAVIVDSITNLWNVLTLTLKEIK